MKTKTLLALAVLLFANVANSQITKNNWLVGGNVNFSSSQYRGDVSVIEDVLTVDIETKIGYFFIDKFVSGLITNFSHRKTKVPGVANTAMTVTIFSLGPYLRYYFLQKDNRVNAFAETSYQYGSFKNNTGFGNHVTYKINSFSFSAGPVMYFNTTVGMEFTLGYLHSKYVNHSDHSNHILIGLGLQIHLEKD